jgi:hypothetical protein
LEPSFYSMLILFILSIPTLSGHKIGHVSSGAKEEPCLQRVSDSRALKVVSNQQVTGGAQMVIN